ncbi:NADH:flavin oxidoreductase/NADH oxidase [Acidisphaera sp. L21]|uniref:NADH:flavin oxidoreductase/NADH oxidase n=1 Tax=Acidisphaera sp. L21 TaxID=1641851 RepID=UPI00131C8D37|nr:NADH:flavin oxidoreductase/NADH oxidase [Acidisphaera sp. L21]
MSLLFSPFTLRGVTFPNRIVVAPMQMYKAGPDGVATDWHFQHLAKYAVGGIGTVMTEALIVHPIGRNTYGDLGIWSDDHIAPLRRIAEFVQAQGSLAAAQLHHAGPKSSRQRPWEGLGPLGEAEAAKGEPPWQPVSSSAAKTIEGWHQPRQMSVEDIQCLVADYGRGAARAAQAGFDVLDIHAAHGYLIHSFLSPVANFRNDAYGGDINGRMRFALEIAESVRANWPDDKPLFFRLSCVDWRPDLDTRSDGWTIEDSFTLSRELRARGVDLIDCSSGGIRAENSIMDFVKTRTKLKRGHQVPYAEAIRRELNMPTMAVGVILDGPQAEAILQAGRADLIAIGREVLTDPHWALHAAQALGDDVDWQRWPPSYGWWLELRDRIGVEG